MKLEFAIDYDDDGEEHPLIQYSRFELVTKKGADKREAVEALIQAIREMVK